MAKQILNEEFRRMQLLAGIITESQLNEFDMDQFSFGNTSSKNSQQTKASFEEKWNTVPANNKTILDKSTGKDTQLVGIFNDINYAIAKGSDGKFYRYQYKQAEKLDKPMGPFDTIEKAKEGIK
jgi:hypothetical protein